MEKVKQISIFVGKYILVSLCAFTVFGLILSITWALPFSEYPSYKLITSTTSAGLAMIVGGYLMGKIMQSQQPNHQALEWGLMIGFGAFGYIFGIDWKWLAALVISGFLSTLGGWLSQK